MKTWKWTPSENAESPRIPTGLSREKGLQVLLLSAGGGQKEGKEHGDGNCTQTMELSPERPC